MPADPKIRPIRLDYDEWLHWNRKYVVRDHPLPAPAVGIFDYPRACLVLNLEWASHVIGALSALYQPDAWTGDDDEQYRAQQEILKLMSLAANACTGGSDVILRQNPADSCQLQQSINGGATWTLAFDYSLCRSNSPSGNYTFYTDIQNQLNTYNQTWDENPTVGDFAPDLVYDGGETEDDQMRDQGLCYAVQMLYDVIAQMYVETVLNPPTRPMFEVIATLAFAIIGGLAAESFSGGLATPIVVAAVSGAVGNALLALGFQVGAAVTAEELESVKNDVVCCIYSALKGSTISESAFQAGADGCDFVEDSPEARVATVVSEIMHDHDVFLSFLGFMSEAYGIGQLGIELPLCPCEGITVAANVDVPGVDTGFDVTSGTTYAILATGTWNGGAGGDTDADGLATIGGPPFLLPTAHDFSLLWRVGTSGAWQPAGTSVDITPASSGRLYLICNDSPGAYGDNTGTLTVLIGE